MKSWILHASRLRTTKSWIYSSMPVACEPQAMRVLNILVLMWTTAVIQADEKSSGKMTRNELKSVLTAAERLGMKRPHFVCRNDGAISELRKLFHGAGSVLRVSQHLEFSKTNPNDNMVFCPYQITQNTSEHILLSRSTNHPWLILERSLNTKIEEQLHIEIHHQVYFFNLDDLFITERYNINGIPITNSIGQVVMSSKIKSFLYLSKHQDSFIQRRANFRGLVLKAMTLVDGLNVQFNNSIKDKETGWIQDTQGLPMKQLESNAVTGLYVDVLKTLQNDMNFTTDIFTRKDEAWGYPVNGSWVGMIANILNKDADFILGGVTMTLPRITVIDYLVRLSTLTGGIFIGRKGLEEHAWLSFLYPLRTDVWIFLFFNTILLLTVIKCFQILHRKKKFWNRTLIEIVEDIVGDFWMLGASYFGRKSNTTNVNESEPLKIIFFVAFLSGTLVFMAYRSSLTAELAVQRDSMPFETLDELYDTTYRGTTHGQSKAFVRMQAADSPVAMKMHQILTKHDDESLVFQTPREAIQDIIAVPDHAYIYSVEKMYEYPEYKCDVIRPWTNNIALIVSMAFPKNSPYTKFINFKLLERLENGLLSVLQRRHYELNVECIPERKVTLSFLKSISLFGVMAAGFIVSLLMFIVEGLLYGCNRILTKPTSAPKDSKYARTSDYEDELKVFMFKWGISERHSFLTDLEMLHQLRNHKT